MALPLYKARTARAFSASSAGGMPPVPPSAVARSTPAWTRPLAFEDPHLQPLRAYYTICVKGLHSDCFYDGHCEPVEEAAATIDQSAGFVGDSERLAAEVR